MVNTKRFFKPLHQIAQDIDDDRYVAVMGGGMGAGNSCLGSGVFVVDLEGGADQNSDLDLAQHDAGKLLTDGPILILDSDPDRSKWEAQLQELYKRQPNNEFYTG